MVDTQDWAEPYGAMIAALPALAASAPLTFCGMGACVDACVSLHAIGPMLDAADARAARFARTLQHRAASGVGGELAYDWPEGPGWIAAHLPVRYAMGGTGPHAAWVLSAVGAPALLALQQRGPRMMALVPPAVLLAGRDGLTAASDAATTTDERPAVFIFEYTAGHPVGAVVPPRSSRIIVRFADIGLEHDDDFDRITRERAGKAGAAVVGGFSAVPPAAMAQEVARVFGLVGAWRAAGLDTVHLELAGYDPPPLVHDVLAAARGAAPSIGMSHSEFIALDGGEAADLAAAMAAFGDRHGADRVCVHADGWAAAVTRRDPEAEARALMMGCLLAAARAGAGAPVRPEGLPEGTRFAPLPFAPRRSLGAWRFTACPSPYLPQPATTLGLGDTFTAGCLLVLGQAARRAAP